MKMLAKEPATRIQLPALKAPNAINCVIHYFIGRKSKGIKPFSFSLWVMDGQVVKAPDTKVQHYIGLRIERVAEQLASKYEHHVIE